MSDRYFRSTENSARHLETVAKSVLVSYCLFIQIPTSSQKDFISGLQQILGQTRYSVIGPRGEGTAGSVEPRGASVLGEPGKVLPARTTG